MRKGDRKGDMLQQNGLGSEGRKTLVNKLCISLYWRFIISTKLNGRRSVKIKGKRIRNWRVIYRSLREA